MVSLKTTRGTRRCSPAIFGSTMSESAAGREVIQPLEGLSAQPVVMVAEEHVLALSRIQADVARLAGPACVRLVNDANVAGTSQQARPGVLAFRRLNHRRRR